MVTLMLALVLWAPQTHTAQKKTQDCPPGTQICIIGEGDNISDVHTLYSHPAMKPEPMDVPAVKAPDLIIYGGEQRYVYMHGFSQGCTDAGGIVDYKTGSCRYKRWTCSDKSRILLTGEDGTRHCIKFPKD